MATVDAPPRPTTADAEQLNSLRDAASAFLAREASIKRLRRLRGDKKDFDRTLWRTIAEMGWSGLAIPEVYGGLGLGLSETAAIAELCGAHLLPEPFVPVAGFAAGTIALGDNEPLKARLLPAIAQGEIIAAVAWQGDDVHALDPTETQVTARANVDGFLLSGTARFVRPGAEADGYVVSARGASGAGLYWVPVGDSVRAQIEHAADGSAEARIKFDAVRVPAGGVLAAGETATRALARSLDEALILVGAELLGVTRRALAITIDYLKTRTQFGRPIGSFQALQHRAVDLLIQTELAGALVDEAVVTAPALSPPERAALASRVKSRCADAASLVARESIQLHGAIGFTDECDIGLYLKRALVLGAWLGNSAFHRRRYARLTTIKPTP